MTLPRTPSLPSFLKCLPGLPGLMPRGLVAPVLLAALLSAGPAQGGGPPVPDPPFGSPARESLSPPAALATAIRTHLLQGHAATMPPEQEELLRLYQADAHAPLWLDAQGHPGPAVEEALRLLAGAATEGLEPADYQTQALSDLARRLRAAAFPNAHELARLELGLSRALLSYLRHLHLGRVDPASLGFRLPPRAQVPDFPSLLQAARAEGQLSELTARLAPDSAQYRGLRKHLARYRSLAREAALPPLPPSAPVQPGDRYPGVQALHRRLVALGDLAAGAPLPAGAIYNDSLVEAVRSFQRRHGLEDRGVLDRGTWAALNVPLERRVRQIELALERQRWLPAPDGRPFLAVNIPMFRLEAWEPLPPQDGRPALRMKVIVGKSLDTQTPVFFEEMRYLVFSPYWNVPASIVRDELLPALRRNPRDWVRKGMELVQGESDKAVVVPATAENLERLRQGKLRLRQRPGRHNALGPVKFIFPNAEAVYLHGTSTPRLFRRTQRDLSHGCVRVEDPVALAQWVLKDQPQWTRERIEAAMRGKRPLRVDLTQPVPVLLYYVTAAVMPEDASIHFARDIYGHDRQLEKALARRRAL